MFLARNALFAATRALESISLILITLRKSRQVHTYPGIRAIPVGSMRHQEEPEHACWCVSPYINQHWNAPKSHLNCEESSSYELYWLPADPASGCPVEEQNPRAIMRGAVTGEVPRALQARGVSLRLWEAMTSEMLLESPPTTVFFGLMVIPICCAFPCVIANSLRLRAWNRFMESATEKYRGAFAELGIALEWRPMWRPQASSHGNFGEDEEAEGKYRHRRQCCSCDRDSGPTLRFVWQGRPQTSRIKCHSFRGRTPPEAPSEHAQRGAQ